MRLIGHVIVRGIAFGLLQSGQRRGMVNVNISGPLRKMEGDTEYITKNVNHIKSEMCKATWLRRAYVAKNI